MQAAGAAFECSDLARWAQEPVERTRLFKYGYDASLRLIPVWSNALPKDSDELIFQQKPDFLVGYMFAAARDSAEKKIFEPKVTTPDVETIWRQRARAQFEKLNCRLIGLASPR
jgi:hypothetical protein